MVGQAPLYNSALRVIASEARVCESKEDYLLDEAPEAGIIRVELPQERC